VHHRLYRKTFNRSSYPVHLSRGSFLRIRNHIHTFGSDGLEIERVNARGVHRTSWSDADAIFVKYRSRKEEVLKGRNRSGDLLSQCPIQRRPRRQQQIGAADRGIFIRSLRRIFHVFAISTWPRVILSFLFEKKRDSRRKCTTWPRRSPRTWCSSCSASLARGSTTGRALRSESEDRLIASSVDEEAEKEVVGRPEPRAIRHCNNHVSSPARIPRDGSPAWPRRMRLDTTENRAVP